jgi:hypothetical protein
LVAGKVLTFGTKKVEEVEEEAPAAEVATEETTAEVVAEESATADAE